MMCPSKRLFKIIGGLVKTSYWIEVEDHYCVEYPNNPLDRRNWVSICVEDVDIPTDPSVDPDYAQITTTMIVPVEPLWDGDVVEQWGAYRWLFWLHEWMMATEIKKRIEAECVLKALAQRFNYR